MIRSKNGGQVEPWSFGNCIGIVVMLGFGLVKFFYGPGEGSGQFSTLRRTLDWCGRYVSPGLLLVQSQGTG